MAAPTAAAVIIPARNEAELLPRCLDSLEIAITQVTIPVYVVVALDSCTDQSSTVARARSWVTAIEVEAGNVGQARASAASMALELAAVHRLDRLWLASTDADSIVPADWLAVQLALAADGWEAAVGTVDVDDWSEHPLVVRDAWHQGYQAVEHHAHVHGANLGLTAAAYVEVGGFPPLAVGEDVALIARLSERRVIRTATHPVITSGRSVARASGGFGDHLRSLAG